MAEEGKLDSLLLDALRKAVFGPAKGVTTIKDWRNYQKHVAIALLFLIFCLFAYLDSFATLENKLEDRFLQKAARLILIS
jgi:hypothetical protein